MLLLPVMIPTIDGVVVGRELDHGFLAWAQERDVMWANLGFHQQSIVQRDHLNQIAARLNHAANSIDYQPSGPYNATA